MPERTYRQEASGGGPLLSLLPIIAIVGAALLFLLTKLRLFEFLTYHGDIFLHTQIARGPLDGRPLFFDNFYSPNSYIHNYLLLILLGPLVKLFGTPSLLAVHALILGVAAYKTYRFLKKRLSDLNSVRLPLLTSLTLFFGPYSFWLLDDPAYGWHSELLFFPLGVLFFLSLLERSWERYLFGALLVLNREDGAVLACSLHLLASLLSEFHSYERRENRDWGKIVFKLAGISLFWFGVLLLGLGALYLFADPAISRQTNASNNLLLIVTDSEKLSAIRKMLGGTALLLLLPALPLLLPAKRVLALIGALLPTLSIALLASATYLSKPDSALYHGTSWPPRFAMLFAICGSGVLIGSLSLFQKGAWQRALFSLFFFLALQEGLLILVRDYSSLKTAYQAWFNTSQFPIARLKPREKRFLECLSSTLPKETSIAHTGGFGKYFYNHDFSPGDNVKDAWRFPELFLCDSRGRIPGERSCLKALSELSSPSFTIGQVKSLQYAVAAGSPAAAIVGKCRGNR